MEDPERPCRRVAEAVYRCTPHQTPAPAFHQQPDTRAARATGRGRPVAVLRFLAFAARKRALDDAVRANTVRLRAVGFRQARGDSLSGNTARTSSRSTPAPVGRCSSLVCWRTWSMPRGTHHLVLPPAAAVMYGEPLYRTTTTMAAEKTVSMSFRVSPRFKALLEVAAARENRSLTNMLETLLFAHCEQHSLKEPASSTSKAKGAKQ